MSNKSNTVTSANFAALPPQVTGSGGFISAKGVNGVNSFKILVDCGLFQEQEYEELNKTFPFKPEKLDVVLVTHAHADHIGRLPQLVKEGFSGRIYTSHDSRTIMQESLKNSAKIMKKESDVPLYNQDDVKNTMYKVKGVDFEKTVEVMPGINVTFFANGHIPGAACILVQISTETAGKSINLFFTGDYHHKNCFFDVPELPNWVTELPMTIITESTYGDETSDNVDYCFKRNIAQAVRQKQDIVIPTLALGRQQTILYVIKCMQEEGLIDPSYTIVLDGVTGQNFTYMFAYSKVHIKDEMLDFLPDNLLCANKINRKDILNMTPKIVITTSGMGSFGPAQVHIPDVLGNKAGLIHFTSYLAEGTLGRKLKETATSDSVVIGGKSIVKRGTIKFTEEFSSHSKSDEIIKYLLEKFKNPLAILINHGNFEAKNAFKELCKEKLNAKDVEIMNRHRYFIIGPEGLKDVRLSNF